MDVFSNFFSPSFQQPSLEPPSTCLQTPDAILSSLPASHSDINAVFVNNNFAVIPGDWQSGDLTSTFYDILPSERCVADALSQIKAADFIALHPSFFDLLGPNAKVQKIQSFPEDQQHVHEAPIYLPETNELLYSDTSLSGILYALNIDTHAVREIHANPPLHNVNGGTLHRGVIYLTTNGGPVRGIHTLNLTTGETTPILNNFRGRHFNSPNDLIFDSKSNLYFTDPTYGYDQSWPGVQEPELPQAIYKFDPRTKAIATLSNSVVGKPNGLALSADEKTLYAADSSSTTFNLAHQRAVFAFDVRQPGGLLENPRLIHQIESGWPDGLRVTEQGLLVVAVAGGADIVDPENGLLLGKINAPDDWIFNVEPARGKGVWLLTGKKHIYKVTMQEGPVEPWIAGSPPIVHKAMMEPLQRLMGLRKN